MKNYIWNAIVEFFVPAEESGHCNTRHFGGIKGIMCGLPFVYMDLSIVGETLQNFGTEIRYCQICFQELLLVYCQQE
jgi:hypothetical protein